MSHTSGHAVQVVIYN